MSTLISTFRPALRIMTDDWDPAAYARPDAILDQGVQTAIQLGRVSSPTGVVLALTPAQDALTPDVASPNTFALVTLHTAKLFLAPQRDRYAYKTRAVSESFGSLARYVAGLEAEIHELENGSMFLGYQNYFSWLSGMSGLPVGEVLAQFDVNAPLWRATLTRDGMRASAG